MFVCPVIEPAKSKLTTLQKVYPRRHRCWVN
jgi:hypothetical protein